jgi:hypothetical protein
MEDPLEINEDKYGYALKEETERLENIGEIISKTIENDHPLSLKLPNQVDQKIILSMNLKNLELKDQILLAVINTIDQDLSNEKRDKILFEPCIENKKLDKLNKTKSMNIYNSINREIHLILHGKKNLEKKNCIYLTGTDVNLEVSILKNGIYDRKICNLKETNKIFEFIGIKSLMISITNYMNELIDSYISCYENNENKIDDEHPLQEGEWVGNEEIYIEIYKDFVKKSNICSELEEALQFSLGSFKAKYQMHFTLSELFTDIFWNSIFHNKTLCKLFIDIYSNIDDIEKKINLEKIRKVIFGMNIPLKHQIIDLLELHHIEKDEKNDLMTLIAEMKNIYHNELMKLEKEKEKEKGRIESNKNEENEINIDNIKINNINEFINNDKNNNLLKNKKEMIIDENIRCNIIKANDIGKFKQKKAKAFLAHDEKNNNIILPVENNNCKNEDKEKNNNDNINNDTVPDFSNKSVDEIVKYINDDKIVDKSSKVKRKKKSRKNKKAKKEEALAEQNKIEIEDSLVLKFKEDLAEEFIHAGAITKIKPVISDNWLKHISTYY